MSSFQFLSWKKTLTSLEVCIHVELTLIHLYYSPTRIFKLFCSLTKTWWEVLDLVKLESTVIYSIDDIIWIFHSEEIGKIKVQMFYSHMTDHTVGQNNPN